MKKLLILLPLLTLLSCHQHSNPVIESIELNDTECARKKEYKYMINTTFGSFVTSREYHVGDTLK